MNALEVKNVYFRQGDFIFKNLNFELKEGELLVLKGSSGSGKSTLIQLIGNAKKVSAGKILYYNKELYEDEYAIRKRMSVVYDYPNFNTEFSGKKIAKTIHKFEPFFSIKYFKEKMNNFGIDENVKVRQFSTEMEKKFMVILALSRTPDILIMDEPTCGLDEEARNDIWNMIFEYKQNHKLSILFSSHHEHEMELLANGVICLENGGVL